MTINSSKPFKKFQDVVDVVWTEELLKIFKRVRFEHGYDIFLWMMKISDQCEGMQRLKCEEFLLTAISEEQGVYVSKIIM